MCVACIVADVTTVGLAYKSLPAFFAYPKDDTQTTSNQPTQTTDKINHNKVFDGILIFLIILNILPVVAPIAAYFGLYAISEPIYFIYSLSCHQFHWRSIHLFGNQIAWCTRDTFIWLGVLVSSVAARFNFLGQGLSWKWVIVFTIPIALDGGIQTIATVVGFENNEQFYLSTNLLRMITGGIFGLGLGAFAAPFLVRELNPLAVQPTMNLNNILKNFFVLFSILFVFYLALVQLWRITSPTYTSAGLVDHIVREAPDVKEWSNKRRLNDGK